MIRAVTFDVTHTLIHCPRLGEIDLSRLPTLLERDQLMVS